MISILRIVRHYWWLLSTFIRKNARLVIISGVVTFFFLVLIINAFPFIDVIFFKKKEIIGIVGKYTVSTTPTEILALLSNPLVSINENGDLTPLLVNSWEITDENKKYIFHLKSNLYWSDGKKFTASDIDIKFGGIEKRVIDDYTIEFRLNQPLSIFPVYLTKPIVRFPLRGVAGLYQVQSYRKSRNNYLQTLNLYPNKAGMPYRIYRFYDNEDDLIAAYKKGQIDIMQTAKKNVADLFSQWKNTTVTRSVNYQQILTLFFNTASKPFKMREMRKAFAYAIGHYDDVGVAASGPIPPASWAHVSSTKTYSFDLDKAKAEFEDNQSATESSELTLDTFYDYIYIAEKMKNNFQKMGAKINLRVLSYIPNDFDMLLTVWNPPVDPDQYYFWHSMQERDNITNYKNVKVDKLLEDGRKVINIDERKKIYKEFQETIIDDLPAYFILYPYVYTIERK